MHAKLVSENAGVRTFVVVLEAGDEAFAAITDFARQNKLSAASLTAIGAFERATVGWFDLAKKTYRPIEITSQCEGLSLLGDIATGDDGQPSLHMRLSGVRPGLFGPWRQSNAVSERRQAYRGLAIGKPSGDASRIAGPPKAPA